MAIDLARHAQKIQREIAPAQFIEYATYARTFGLKGSCGSDFHAPGESWLDFGDLPPLPVGVEPVWSTW